MALSHHFFPPLTSSLHSTHKLPALCLPSRLVYPAAARPMRMHGRNSGAVKAGATLDLPTTSQPKDGESSPRVLLEVRDLTAVISESGQEILHGVNLLVREGEIHAVMGRNGSGKSTFSKVLVGHPDYEVTGGSVVFKGENLLELEPEERSHAGIFLSFQSPVEIPGVSNIDFLRMAYNARRVKHDLPELDPLQLEKYRVKVLKNVFHYYVLHLSMYPDGKASLRTHKDLVFINFDWDGCQQREIHYTFNGAARASAALKAKFYGYLSPKLAALNMDPKFLNRNVNEGFSGGEKKRNEILQLAVLGADLAILDEIDSGLDVDALQDVASAVNGLLTPKNSVLMITHYQRLLDYIKPNFVHIMEDGRIVRTGDVSLARQLEQEGYRGISAA